MTQTQHRSWGRFAASVVVLIFVVVAIPAFLIVCSRLSLDSAHPLPGVGSIDEIRSWASRELSVSEMVPILLRSLLVVGWVLWALLISSVLAAVVTSRPRFSHWTLPSLPVFDGFAAWVAAGLTALSSFAPATTAFAEAGPPVPQSVYATLVVDEDASVDVARAVAVPDGYVQVQTGESVQKLALRTLGDSDRWEELWELRSEQLDDGSNKTWTQPWRIEAGWLLKLPSSTGPSVPVPSTLTPAPVATPGTPTSTGIDRASVVVDNGGSYWQIASDLATANSDNVSVADIAALTSALRIENAPRLGYENPDMLHPGDVVFVDVVVPVEAPVVVPAGAVVVEPGGSYWNVALDMLAAETGEIPSVEATHRLTEALIAHNAPLLGYTDPTMLHPGDVVLSVSDTATTSNEDVAASEAPVDRSVVESVPEVQIPDTVVDDASAPSVSDFEPPEATVGEVRVVDDVAVAPPSEVPTAPTVTGAPATSVDESTTDETSEVGMAPVRDVRPVWLFGITGATALATALWAAVRALRRRNAVRGGGYAADYATSSIAIDEALRASADPDLIDWANEELSDLVDAYGVNETRSLPVVVEMSREAGLTVHWDLPRRDVPSDWAVNIDDTSWSLPFDPNHIEGTGTPAGMPALVTIGERQGHHVMVDIESCGSIALRGDMTKAESLMRSVVLELGAGGVLSNAHVHTVGLDIDGTEHLPRVQVRSESAAIEHLRAIRVQHDQVLNESGRTSMLEVRSASTPAGREVTVVVVRASSCVRLDELIESAGPQHGVALVVVGDADCATTIDLDSSGTATIEPLGIAVGAHGVSRQLASTLAIHLDRLSAPIDDVMVPAAVESAGSDPWTEPTRLVRVLGTPSVDGETSLAFNETELIAFVASHNGSVTDDEIADGMSCGRTSRSDVWSVVSAIRASAGDLVLAREEGGNTIALGTGSMLDVDWMSRLAFRSHTHDDNEAVDDLIKALALVRGAPFDTTAGFGWATTSGAFARALQMIERTGYLLASRAISAERYSDGADALRAVINKVGVNEPLTQSLIRLERQGGNTGGAETAYGEFSRELVFRSDGPEPMQPSSGTTTLLDADVDVIALEVGIEPIAHADDDTSLEMVRETVRPLIVLRTFGDVCAEGTMKTQALAVPFAVASQQRAMSGEELAEVTGYSTKTMSTAFTTEHEILERKDGELSLRDGVWTDHQWMRECARRAGDADSAGDVIEVTDWLHTLFAEVNRIDGAAFEKVPGKRAYWSWVDDFPADVSARSSAQNEMVEAVLAGIDVWKSAGVNDQIPADVVVRAACNLAKLAPFAAVARSLRPDDARSGGESLLRAAHGVAVGRVELVHTVVSTAQQMVANDQIEASNDLADALDL